MATKTKKGEVRDVSLAREGVRRIEWAAREMPVVRGADIEHVPWSLDREVDDVLRCDVGVYPLWDDAWAQGKCGFKAIQFMACGVPVVASAIGANRHIIQDGINGYLASTAGEWVEKLTRLLTDPELDVLTSGESDFEELPAVMEQLSRGPDGTLCHRVRYPTVPPSPRS